MRTPEPQASKNSPRPGGVPASAVPRGPLVGGVLVAFGIVLLVWEYNRPLLSPVVASPSATEAGDEQLPDRVTRVLESSLRDRRLTIDQHAAWQVLHAALAYGRGFSIEHDGKPVSAIDYLFAGGTMKGWVLTRGTELEPGKFGLFAPVDTGSKVGQGHADQWLGYLALCDLPEDTVIRVGGENFTMLDLVAQSQWDVPQNALEEYSWTIVGLTRYLPTTNTWRASDGRMWSTEQLVLREAEQEVVGAACGGTHRLIGLAYALDRHRRSGGRIEGGWKKAEQRITQAAGTIREFQNGDGSFSSNSFERAGRSQDLALNLATTGHQFEFLMLSLSDEQLRERWVARAAEYMCRVLEETSELPLECGALYHAARGLKLYRQRLDPDKS